MLKETGQGNWEIYLDRIGLFFIFTACAGISLIVWIFNWICWLNQCCCCDFLHNPVNKRIAWWMSFSFLLGILACCISAFVSVNRFGFALEGAWCAVDRIYYDSLYGQLKNSEPMWKGFINIANVSTSLFHIHNYISKVNDDNNNRKWKSFLLPKSKNNIDLTFNKDLNLFYYLDNNENKIPNNEERICLARYTKIIISLEQLSDQIIEATEDILNTNSIYEEKKFKEIKNEFLVEFDYYARILRACLKVLAMIYYCLFLIVITSAGVSMMFYACLKRQGYLLTFMHVLWNVIRFFMFSFFLYGTAYGIGFLAIGDSIAYMMYVFNENLYEDKPKLIKINSRRKKIFYRLFIRK